MRRHNIKSDILQEVMLLRSVQRFPYVKQFAVRRAQGRLTYSNIWICNTYMNQQDAQNSCD